MGFVCSYFEFLKLNVKYNDVKYAIVYFRKNNNWCVSFVNLLENEQTPVYFTLYRGYYYRLRNQFTLKEQETMYRYWKVQYNKNNFGLTPGVEPDVSEQGVGSN